MSRTEAQSASPNEIAMLNAYKEQVKQILDSRERFEKSGDEIKCGIEVEYGLVDESQQQTTQNFRDAIISENDEFTDAELGAAQIEIRTDPVDIRKDPSILLDQLIERDGRIILSSKKKGLSLLSHGTNPFVPTRGILRSKHTKYQLVPDHHNDNQRQGLVTMIGCEEKVDVGDAAIIGIANSVQANIEANNDIDAVDKLNRSFQIGPMAVSLFANARFFDAKDTGIQDIRMIGWEISHDTRTEEEIAQGKLTRVGMPERYYTSLEDYFTQIAQYPFILDAPQAALPIGIGLNWRDTRIKVVKNSLVVEFRPVSTQSTPEENYAAMMFYVGRLLWSQHNNEVLFPMEYIVQNRNQAMYEGTDACLWTNLEGSTSYIPSRDALKIEIDRASEGLQIAQIRDETIQDAMDLLKMKTLGENPSRYLARLRNSYLNKGEEKLSALVLAMQQTQGMK